MKALVGCAQAAGDGRLSVKRVNLTLLLALTVAVGIAIVGTFFLRRFQIQRNAGGLAKLARQRLDEGKSGEALLLFQRYVGLRPEDSAAFAEYAELMLRKTESSDATRADLAKAYTVVEDAVRRNPTNDTLRAQLARFQLRVGRFADAREHLLVLRDRLAVAGAETRPDAAAETGGAKKLTTPGAVALMLARSHLGTGDFDRAAAITGEIVGFDVESRSFGTEPAAAAEADAYILLAAILQEEMEDLTAASRVLEQLVKVRPDDAQAWLAMSRWHRQQGDASAAGKDLDRALEIAPDDPEVLFASFEQLLAAGDLARAEPLARQARQSFPADERGYRAVATICLQQGRPEEAEQVLRDGIAAIPTRASLLLMLTDLQLQRNEVDEAQRTLDRVKGLFGQTNPAVGLFEARILIARQRWLQARQRLRELRPLVAGVEELTRQVDLYLGQCAEQLGEFDEQLAAHQRVLSDAPTSLPARIGAASALMAAGKADEALAGFEAVVASIPPDRLPSVPQAWLPMLQLQVAAQARLPAERRDWSRIDALLERLQQAPEVSASQMALLRADVLVRKGEFDAAAAVLDKAAAADAGNPQLAAARGSLALRRQGPAAARDILAKLPEDVGGNPAVLTIDAQVAAAEGRDAAVAAFARIEARARGLPDEPAARLLSQLAGLSLGFGDRDAAERLWTEAAARQPDDTQSRSALFELALDSGDLARAEAAATALGKVAGDDSPQGRVARAAVAITAVRKALVERQAPDGAMPELAAAERQKLDEARNLLVEAENVRPGWGRIQTLYAEVEGLKGDVTGAIDRLQRAVSLGATNPAVVRQLVSLLYATNRIEEARRALASIGPEAAGLERLSAEVEMRAGRFDQAVAFAEKTVAADSKNADELLWLGQLLERSGKRDKAQEIVERAVDAAPHRPETWLTLFSLQLAAGRRRAAEQTLDRSADKLADPQRGLTLAQGNEMLGRLDDAERFYREAAAASPGDIAIQRRLAEFLLRAGRLRPARDVLDGIIAAATASTADRATQAWARRVVAELVAERGTFRAFQAALQTLQRNADARGQLGPEDLDLKARLLASRPEPVSWREGIDTLTALAKLQPLSTGQKLQLAELRDRTGRWEECRDGLISIASSPNTPPAILVRLVEKLVDHGELSAARTWLRRLQTTVPDAPMTLAIEAKYAIAAGDRETAVAAARKLMPAADAAPERQDDLRTIAQLYEELGFIKAADKVLGQLAAASTEGIVNRAAFLGRQKQTAEALDLLESCWDKAPLERLMQAAVEVIRDSEDPAAADRIDPWFAKAIRQDPESVTLPLLLAEVRDLQGRNRDTETIYRDLLARERLDPIPMAIITNNLAFHLARPETAAEARTLIDAAIEELGPHPDLLDTRGMVALATGDAQRAIKDLQEATLQPTATKLLHLACAQLQAGDAAAAARTLEDARKKQLRPTRLSSADRERLTALEAALARPPA
jgi:tetratricopeptide (TPR) repeat protein